MSHLSDSPIRELFTPLFVLAVSVIIAFAPDAYLPMLIRAFIVPAVTVTAVLVSWAVWRRRWWLAVAAGTGSLVMIAQLIVPSQSEDGSAEVAHEGAALRVFHMNVLQPNTSYAEAIAQALQSQADIISVQEVDPRWGGELSRGLHHRYPYSHVVPRENCYGIALFSKVPFGRVETFESAGAPFIEACFAIRGRPLRLIAVHATSPISYGHFRRRNEQLRALGERIALNDTSTIVVGDLNTVPWDQAYRRFCARAGLRSGASAPYRTWPSIGPFAAIPLDHILVSEDLLSTGFTTVDIPGSDHLGLYAELYHR